MLDTVLILGAYLVGSLSAAIIVCRLSGLPDPREQGSGNPGATNVLRFGGKKLAAIVLVGDMLKGLIPVIVAISLSVSDPVLAAVGLAAFLGHLYPAFFGFKGGKGVATALGVILGICWPTALILIAIWLAMALVFHFSSLAAITATLSAPFLIWTFRPQQPEFIVMAFIMSLLLFWRHRSNIKKLLSGTESRIGNK